jgi:hypothetical protein
LIARGARFDLFQVVEIALSSASLYQEALDRGKAGKKVEVGRARPTSTRIKVN